MAMNGDLSAKDEQKTHFSTREGVYNLMPIIEYYSPIRTNYSATPSNPVNNVHISLVTIPGVHDYSERICINVGKDLYVYIYKGINCTGELINPLEKKTFKAMNPTCHNFNEHSVSSESIPLLIGFNVGIITMQDLIRKDVYKVFNEEKLVDNTKVTCIQWIPNSKHLFLTSHASGQLYLYNEELPCNTSPPIYQLFKSGEGFAIYVCKTKSTRNPLYRWVIGSENCCINQFAFSPCNLYLAVVSQDGYLRVFHYDTMELIGVARSYFGGLLCVCWSPDSEYIAVGGEDDLVTIWSFQQKQIIARGQGHHSWINVVAFDPYTSSIPSSNITINSKNFSTCYRLGSVGQDTQLCLWDLTEDILRLKLNYNNNNNNNINNSSNPKNKPNDRVVNGKPNLPTNNLTSNKINSNLNVLKNHKNSKDNHCGASKNAIPSLAGLDINDHQCGSTSKRNSSAKHNIINSDKNGTAASSAKLCAEKDDPMKLIGTGACPRFDQCSLLEPLVRKKIANERLSALVFKEDCILTACYDGLVYTWARPGRVNNSSVHLSVKVSPSTTNISNECYNGTII